MVLPDHKINVCKGNIADSAIDNVVTAVQQWAATINRTSHLTVRKACDHGDGDALINVSSPKRCTNNGTSCFYGTGHLTYQIEISSKRVDKLGTALHEVGHAWGNCDRYGNGGDEQLQYHNDCNGQRGGSLAPSAMMSSYSPSYPGHVTDDDAAGMQAMAKDTSISANAAWLQLTAPTSGAAGDVATAAPVTSLSSADTNGAKQPTGGTDGSGKWCDAYNGACFPYCTTSKDTGGGFGWQPELGGPHGGSSKMRD